MEFGAKKIAFCKRIGCFNTPKYRFGVGGWEKVPQEDRVQSPQCKKMGSKRWHIHITQHIGSTLPVVHRSVTGGTWRIIIYYMSNINELPDGILFHWFYKCTPPWMFLPVFLPLDIPSEYRPEHVTFGLLCVIIKFPSRIFCRRVRGFATDCPCGVWCRGLTTCLLYVGPPLEF